MVALWKRPSFTSCSAYRTHKSFQQLVDTVRNKKTDILVEILKYQSSWISWCPAFSHKVALVKFPIIEHRITNKLCSSSITKAMRSIIKSNCQTSKSLYEGYLFSKVSIQKQLWSDFIFLHPNTRWVDSPLPFCLSMDWPPTFVSHEVISVKSKIKCHSRIQSCIKRQIYSVSYKHLLPLTKIINTHTSNLAFLTTNTCI